MRIHPAPPLAGEALELALLAKRRHRERLDY